MSILDTLHDTGQVRPPGKVDERTKLNESPWENPSRGHSPTPEPSRLARKARDVIYEMDRINRDALAVLTDAAPSEQAMRRFRATMVAAHHYAKERRMKRMQERA